MGRSVGRVLKGMGREPWSGYIVWMFDLIQCFETRYRQGLYYSLNAPSIVHNRTTVLPMLCILWQPFFICNNKDEHWPLLFPLLFPGFINCQAKLFPTWKPPAVNNEQSTAATHRHEATLCREGFLWKLRVLPNKLQSSEQTAVTWTKASWGLGGSHATFERHWVFSIPKLSLQSQGEMKEMKTQMERQGSLACSRTGGGVWENSLDKEGDFQLTTLLKCSCSFSCLFLASG